MTRHGAAARGPVRLAPGGRRRRLFRRSPPAGSLRPGDRHRPFAGRAAPVAQPPLGCAGLVCINGFARFGAGPTFPKARRACSTACCGSFVAQPQAVLRDFARAAATTRHPARSTWPRWNAVSLALRDEDRRAGLAALPMPALALAGAEDPVVPPAMTGAALLGVALCMRGGHLLPRSDPQWCAGHIRDFALGLAGIGADMNGRARNAAIGARFGRAAARYEAHARPSARRRAAPGRGHRPAGPAAAPAHPGDRLRHRTADARAGAPPGTGRLDAHRHIPGHAGDRAARSRAARQRALRGAGRRTSRRPARRLRPHLLQPGGAVVRRPERGLGRLAALLARAAIWPSPRWPRTPSPNGVPPTPAPA